MAAVFVWYCHLEEFIAFCFCSSPDEKQYVNNGKHFLCFLKQHFLMKTTMQVRLFSCPFRRQPSFHPRRSPYPIVSSNNRKVNQFGTKGQATEWSDKGKALLYYRSKMRNGFGTLPVTLQYNLSMSGTSSFSIEWGQSFDPEHRHGLGHGADEEGATEAGLAQGTTESILLRISCLTCHSSFPQPFFLIRKVLQHHLMQWCNDVIGRNSIKRWKVSYLKYPLGGESSFIQFS